MTGNPTSAHSRNYRNSLWFIASALIALGVYLTMIRFMHAEWLSRAGCLVVMLGIWSGIGGVLQERLFFMRSKHLRRNAITAAKARLHEEGGDADRIEKELGEINTVFDNQIADATQNIRLSIGILELSLLITGTFLWGFGDLIMQFAVGA